MGTHLNGPFLASRSVKGGVGLWGEVGGLRQWYIAVRQSESFWSVEVEEEYLFSV